MAWFVVQADFRVQTFCRLVVEFTRSLTNPPPTYPRSPLDATSLRGGSTHGITVSLISSRRRPFNKPLSWDTHCPVPLYSLYTYKSHRTSLIYVPVFCIIWKPWNVEIFQISFVFIRIILNIFAYILHIFRPYRWVEYLIIRFLYPEMPYYSDGFEKWNPIWK